MRGLHCQFKRFYAEGQRRNGTRRNGAEQSDPKLHPSSPLSIQVNERYGNKRYGGISTTISEIA
jgi:hypothetical protein